MKNCVERRDFMELLAAIKPLAAAPDFKAVANIAVKIGMVVSGCGRASLIVANKRGELILKAGLPREGHQIGKIQYGENFLKAVLDSGKYKLVSSPLGGADVAYMKDLIMTFGISAILFLPLVYKGEDLGVLVLDKVGGKFSNRDIRKAQMAAEYISAALWREYRRKLQEGDAVQGANLRALGENAATVAHSFRNPLMSMGGFLGRMKKKIAAAREAGVGEGVGEILEKLHGYCEIVMEEKDRMSRRVDDIVRFAGTSARKMELRLVILDGFLREAVMSLVRGQSKKMKVRFSVQPCLGRARVKMDPDAVKFAIEDIVRNAIEANGSSTIKVKAKIGKNHRRRGEAITTERVVIITIANDGEPIDEGVINEVFNPLMTTKSDGTGLGLANARAVVEAHHGRIWAEGKDNLEAKYRTKFKIHLPLR